MFAFTAYTNVLRDVASVKFIKNRGKRLALLSKINLRARLPFKGSQNSIACPASYIVDDGE